MKIRKLCSLLAPTLYVVLLLGLVRVFLPNPSEQVSRESSVSDETIEKTLAAVDSVVHPRPILAPHEVVQIQLDGLASEDASGGILQCMVFASPGNRAVTGPLVRFAKMVRSPPFDVLANPETVLIGKEILEEGVARILVTVVREERIYPFVWVLSQQDMSPYEGCWMTDGVFPLSFEQASGLGSGDKPNSI